MSFEVRIFQTSKAGSKPEECEDALSFDPQGRLFAIADGATDSAFQRLWAGLLVKGFVSNPPDFSRPSSVKEWFGGWLKTQQEIWNNNIDWNNIPFHGYNKAKMTGGLATFLGIYFFPDKPIWKGIAFGDCNLFQYMSSGEYLYDWKPIDYSEQFGSNPVALSSISPKPELMLNHIAEIGDKYRKGDVFFLATDALAACLLKEIESSSNPIKDRLLTLKTPDEFETLVNELRSEKKLKNDDTSLIIIEITKAPDDKSNITQGKKL